MSSKFNKWAGIATLTLLLSAASGCASEEPGSASPQTSSNNPSTSSILPTTPTSATSISLDIDPCELLTTEDLADVGNFDSRYKEDKDVRACFWQNSLNNGGDGFTFAVSIHDTQSIDEMRDYGDGIETSEINRRPAASTQNSKLGDCNFAMKIDDLSRVDVTITGEDSSQAACEAAEVIAGMVEPRLPEIP